LQKVGRKVFLVGHSTHLDEVTGMLEGAGCSVTRGRFITDARPYTEDELVSIAGAHDALMISSWERMTRRVLQGGGRLVTVAKYGIGVEKIDVNAATEFGILVTNTPVLENYLGVAEGAVARILSLAKRFKEAEASLRRGEWKTMMVDYVRGKTVGIIGLGRIGSRVAKLLQPWGARLLAADPYIPEEKAELLNVELVSVPILLAESDFVTIHCAATPETERLIGEPELRAMKKTAYLINTARGIIVDEIALHTALKERKIAGAALDVFEPEPLSLESLLLQPDLQGRLLLTPHISASTPEARRAMAFTQAKNCLDALKGVVPEFVVNPEVLPRWRQRLASPAA